MCARTRRRRYARRRAIGVLALIAGAALVLLGSLSACSALTDGEGAFSGPDEEATSEEADPNDAPAGGERSAAEPGSAEPQRAGNPGARQEPVRAVYLTAPSVDNLDAYLEFANDTDVNAFVIDVKDVTGEVMYPSEVPLANEIGATRDILDLDSLLAELEERDIYAIARIATFEDDILPVARPDLAVTDTATGSQWTNYVGNYWSDPYSREVWEYNAAIAKEVSEAGFDEVQFDYVRFPSDGPMERLSYPSEPEEGSDANPIAGFLEYTDGELEGTDARIAADVFGLAAGENGAGVGQDIEQFAPHVDVLNPMIYPSHYPAGSYGIQNPNARPYRVVSESMSEFREAAGEVNPEIEIRPWLQDFTQGPPEYGPEEVSAQIRAVYDSGETGWLLWNAANVYTDDALRDTGAEDYAADRRRGR
ncbi:putative glycoside hydrolase [Rubrobacter indicoceani]|uniref:putative glycoside hydrolase n=1 Tax=Rubrobacter indicoceani TaxID=2051957 RepID=UPI0013C4F66F|nr:putative glycoside hydrolase [Rubrobacter indicoceani]